jgi:hypothetical protein
MKYPAKLSRVSVIKKLFLSTLWDNEIPVTAEEVAYGKANAGSLVIQVRIWSTVSKTFAVTSTKEYTNREFETYIHLGAIVKPAQ